MSNTRRRIHLERRAISSFAHRFLFPFVLGSMMSGAVTATETLIIVGTEHISSHAIRNHAERRADRFDEPFWIVLSGTGMVWHDRQGMASADLLSWLKAVRSRGDIVAVCRRDAEQGVASEDDLLEEFSPHIGHALDASPDLPAIPMGMALPDSLRRNPPLPIACPLSQR